MTSLRLFLILPLLALSIARGEVPAPSGAYLNLTDGDTVVFLGDSITHQCLYTQYIEDFFYTRYPDRRIHFHSAGVGGDKASDALARFGEDVAAFEPDHVTLLLGMNDGQYEQFNEPTFTTYRDGMTELLDQIKQTGAQAIALSPTMFDHHQKTLRTDDSDFRFREQIVDPHYNGLMSLYGAWVQETASQRSVPYVNLWGPLNDITFQQRRTLPDFSIIEDTIHPGAAGHFIMAFSVLFHSEQEHTNVSAITIIRRDQKWIPSKNERISDLTASAEGDVITFTHLARSLPWVVPTEMSTEPLKWGPSAPASLGFDLTHAGHKLGAERFRVTGLQAGNYKLFIDDQEIGSFTHLALGAKVELQNFPHTPQSQQAMQVALLNQEKNDKVVRPMRDLWSQIKGRRKRLDPKQFQKEFALLKAQIDELVVQAEAYEEKIYQAAAPLPRHYRLVRVTEK